MGEAVRLLDTNTEKMWGCGKRKVKTLGAAAALLVLPSLYFLSPTVNLPNHIHRFGLAPPSYPSSLQSIGSPLPSGYLVWSSECQIPFMDPFEKSVMILFKKREYIPCTLHRITSVVEDESGNGVLHINTSTLEKTLGKLESVSCCYSNITRPKDPSVADLKIIKSKCLKFNNLTKLTDTEEFIMTKCDVKYKRGASRVYEDAHTNIQISKEIKQKKEIINSTLIDKPWNILIVGIDTLSRINLARAMPKTNEFFVKNNWLDFQGYNKIDDNTYPNLMAILTGLNQSRARYTCDRTGEYSPDNCNFMWKRYEKIGYVTVYAEDYYGISTFRKPLHTGFTTPPTNHYLQPLFMAAEKRINKKSQQIFCTGQTSSGEQLFDYALNFQKKYADYPTFGFFWANTFSHDDINSPSSMDEKVHAFFEKLKTTSAMNNTIVIFISDHGLRFGPVRSLLTGYYEERLPAFFVWMPISFREQYPDAYSNLVVNTQRLTNPYDVYMTLQDVLRISQKSSSALQTSEACPLCQSLFEVVPANRSCEESSIKPHWCTCNPFQRLPPNHEISKRAAKFIVDVEIEKALNTVNKEDCKVCAKLKVDKVISSYIYKYLKEPSSYRDYLIVISTLPGNMVFESTVRHHIEKDEFTVEGIVSRLTAYRGKGGCVKTAYLKKYCYCTHNKCK